MCTRVWLHVRAYRFDCAQGCINVNLYSNGSGLTSVPALKGAFMQQRAFKCTCGKRSSVHTVVLASVLEC